MLKLIRILLLSVFIFLSNSAFTQKIKNQYIEILKLQGQEEYDQAIEEYKNLISKHSNFGKAYKSLAEVYIELEQIEDGENYFSNILTGDSLNAYAFYGLARFEFAKNNFNKSIAYYKKCILIDPLFADAFSPYGGLIEVSHASGNSDQAIQYLDSRITVLPQNPNLTYAIARIYHKKNDWQKCVEMLNRTKEIDSNYVFIYHSYATYYQRMGKYKEMSSAAQKLFELSNQQADLQMAAYALSMIGVSHFFYGDYWKALQFNHEGYKIAKSIGAKSREGLILNNIAAFYAMLGLRQKALQFFYSSLDLARKTNSSFGEVRALLNIANVSKELNEFSKAEEKFLAAEELAKKFGFKYEECLIAANLAEVHQLEKKYESAEQKFEEGLNISREIQDKTQEGYILRALGSLHLETGDYEKAINYHNLALEIGKKTEDLQIIWEAQAGLGSDYRKSEKIEEAIFHYSKAIALYDSIRANLDIGMLISNFLDDKYEAFPSLIQMFAGQKKYDQAFFYAEKYKSKILLDILAEGQIYIENLLPDSVRSELNNMRQQIETVHENLSDEYEKPQPDQNKIVEIEQEITNLELKKSELTNQIEDNYNNYFQLTSSEPIKLKKLQTEILDDNQVLIEYILGPDKIAVFVIKKDTVNYIEIDLSRDLLVELLKNVSPMFNRSENDSTENLQIYTADIVDFSIPSIFDLYKKILKPVEKFIPENSNLIIVPDDLLFYVPFEMLIYNTTKCKSKYDFKNAKYLLEKYSISYNSSASLLDQKIKSKRNPTKGFFAIGNPDFKSLFSQDSERLQEFSSIPQLLNSEIEVKKVNEILSGVNREIYIGEEATELQFREEAADYRVIHLATHFFFNDRLPLYSKIALTKHKQETEDGFLNTYEIFNINLNAELVVLSACNSGLGKLSRGEGLLGISRSFFYAGVPSLLLSLWNVDDEATSEIMVGFYKYLKEGNSKNKSLQLAKLDLLKSEQKDHTDPFYWAPFILIGDQSPVQFLEKEEGGFYKYVFLGFVLILVILIWIYWKRKRV